PPKLRSEPETGESDPSSRKKKTSLSPAVVTVSPPTVNPLSKLPATTTSPLRTAIARSCTLPVSFVRHADAAGSPVGPSFTTKAPSWGLLQGVAVPRSAEVANDPET